MDTATRECILAEAMTWKNTPFHHKGRKKGIGVDCGGFIYEVFKHTIGIPHEAFPAHYAEDWALHRDDEIYLDFMRPYVKPVNRPGIGDVIMFKMGRAFSHGTIYIGGNKVIHAYGRTTHGSVLVSPLSFFNVGMSGKERERQSFTVDDRWL